jgi:hypothetical protein
MSQSKREQVVSHLRYIRQELREMHQGVMDDGLLPEAGEVRGVMAQMEALLELLEGKQVDQLLILLAARFGRRVRIDHNVIGPSQTHTF